MLSTVDMSLTLDEETFEKQSLKYQGALRKLACQAYIQQRPVVAIFEGWEASSKDSAIACVTQGIDPRGFVVYPIATPEGEDANHHYLWRFWRRLPRAGQFAIFDQSWYRRVLIECIECCCKEAERKRAYREINTFERQLTDYGTILFKFFLHMTHEEQLHRLEVRSGDEIFPWKHSQQDLSNQEKRDLYENAVNEVLLKTNPVVAPWTVVEANSDSFARIKILKTIVGGLTDALQYNPFDAPKPAPGDQKTKKKRKKKKKK